MTACPADSKALLVLLRQTRRLLAAHAAFGLSSYPAAPELRRFAAGRAAAIPLPPARQPPQPAPAEKKIESAQPQTAALSLSEIARQLADCRRCSAAARPAPGLGAERPKLVVISDCFVSREDGQRLLWSQEEDALFWRMMAAIGLNRNSVYLTSAIKCPQPQPPPIGSSCPEERACLLWLKAELHAIQPRLICVFGEAAARMLLDSGTKPLLRLRKKFHRCQQLETAQVLATYPPRLLLQEPELKRAAWEDLQLLQKRLPQPS